MADVVGIIFPNGTKTYYFDPAGLELSRGDRVVVQTGNGPEIGQVAEPSHAIEDSELPAPLKKVTRLATGKDLEAHAASQNVRKQAMITCREMIDAHGLDMKLVGADISFGGEKITFSFYAEERVDFRTLVADLAKALKTRIELRQVGAREEARMVGGLGPCGRSLCCTLFPPGDDPVSIRMAKEQNLPLNPAKISGLCGRLMCCLKYEQEQYVRFRKEAPPKGTPVATPDGQGAVVGYNVLKDSIVVRLEDGHTSDVKLCCCQCQADGGLLFTPEVDEAAGMPFPEIAGGIRRLAAAEAAEDEELAVIEAEVVLGEDGQPVDVIVAETSRRSRRRGRGRRGGRNPAPGEGGAPGGAGASGEPAAAGANRPGGGGTEGGHPGGNREGGVRHQGQHPPRHPERHRGGVPGHKSEGEVGGQGGGAEHSRPRGPEGGVEGGQEGTGSGAGFGTKRRRRRRRPGGGEGGGSGANGGERGPGGGPSGGGGASGGGD